ncbi:hypothetical protein G6F22_017437 [Rhizopus arrhizus]|nr:hypothetical protein G6F22_017437 [Rhizopus arrhizus]
MVHGQTGVAVRRLARGETPRQRNLLGAQHVDHAPEDQRRVQRHGVEGADRQPDGGAIKAGGSDDRYARGIAAQRGTEERGVKIGGGGGHAIVKPCRRRPSAGGRAGARACLARTRKQWASGGNRPSAAGAAAVRRNVRGIPARGLPALHG